MKKKIITKSYLRNVSKYIIKLYLDEDELEEAFINKDITETDYSLVMKTRDKLINEINNKCNKFMNMDYSKYLII